MADLWSQGCDWSPNNLSVWPCTNGSSPVTTPSLHYSTLFAAVAVSLSSIIFVFGLLGNVLVVVVIVRTRSMHTTTNCYLLSLAVADSLVLLSATLPAIPEPFYRVDEWPFGSLLCSLLIFLQYLGIDASSLSITAFTIERYIAICHPMRAQTMCTISRAKKIIAVLWVFTILYCSPWLGLTEVVDVSSDPGRSHFKCQLRLARSSYLLVYMIDLILLYLLPLLVATVLYLLIGRILYLSRSLAEPARSNIRHSPTRAVVRRADSRVQVVRMLVVVVLAFASLWMPYRVMVVYNSWAQHKYMDMWFLLFARTMIYVNCAINPVLYNIMSVKFKRAFRNHLSCWHRRFSSTPSNYSEVPSEVWASRKVTFNQQLTQHTHIQQLTQHTHIQQLTQQTQTQHTQSQALGMGSQQNGRVFSVGQHLWPLEGDNLTRTGHQQQSREPAHVPADGLVSTTVQYGGEEGTLAEQAV